MKNKLKFRAWNGVGVIYSQSFDTLERFFDMCENYELMQFTGFKDKNEKEIYEGDILQFGGKSKSDVKFENGCFTVFGEPLGWDFDNLEDGVRVPIKYSTTTYCEVIGNIYGNLNLITKCNNEPR